MGFGKVLLGFALCAGGVGVASAMDADAQDMASMQHSVDSPSSGHEGGGNGGGDALGLSRESTPSNGNSSSSSNESSSGTNNTPTPRNRRASLGWQSLLPGSIQ